MARKSRAPSSRSPALYLAITPELHAAARQSDSGGCLIADAIKAQYPQLSSVDVDMATVRVSDRVKGVQYTYLTPQLAQLALVYFDQGWPNPVDHVVIKRAVKIVPIIGHPKQQRETVQRRAERIAALEAKKASGAPLTRGEASALTRMRNAKPPRPRPSARGKAQAKGNGRSVIVGGAPIVKGKWHNPNLLRGRNRIFGAKVSTPGQVFQDAVDAAVAERLAAQDKQD